MISFKNYKSKFSRNINGFFKEIPNTKSSQNDFKILFQKRFTSTNNINMRKDHKKNSFSFMRNKFINRTKVITRLNSFERKTKFISLNNSKSRLFYNPNTFQSNKDINTSKTRTLNNSRNNFSYYVTYRNSFEKKPIKYVKIKNHNMMKNELKNNCLYNYLMNASNIGITKNISNVSLNANKFEMSLRNKFIIAGKDRLKNKLLNEKIKKAILGINKIIPPVIKLNAKKNNISKSYKNIKLNLSNNNLTKTNILKNNQNKTSNNKPNLKFKYKEKGIKNIESKRKTEMNNNKKGLDESIINKAIKEEKEENIFSGISKYTTKVEEEGILELNEVQDLIIYYKLEKESGKDYLFNRNDYANFIQNKMKGYLGFFMS